MAGIFHCHSLVSGTETVYIFFGGCIWHHKTLQTIKNLTETSNVEDGVTPPKTNVEPDSKPLDKEKYL